MATPSRNSGGWFSGSSPAISPFASKMVGRAFPQDADDEDSDSDEAPDDTGSRTVRAPTPEVKPESVDALQRELRVMRERAEQAEQERGALQQELQALKAAQELGSIVDVQRELESVRASAQGEIAALRQELEVVRVMSQQEAEGLKMEQLAGKVSAEQQVQTLKQELHVARAAAEHDLNFMRSARNEETEMLQVHLHCHALKFHSR